MKAQVSLGKCIDTQDPHCSHIQIMDVDERLRPRIRSLVPLDMSAWAF